MSELGVAARTPGREQTEDWVSKSERSDFAGAAGNICLKKRKHSGQIELSRSGVGVGGGPV